MIPSCDAGVIMRVVNDVYNSFPTHPKGVFASIMQTNTWVNIVPSIKKSTLYDTLAGGDDIVYTYAFIGVTQ